MDRLIEARDEEGKGLTLEEIRNEMDTFMFAGGWGDFVHYFWDSLICQFNLHYASFTLLEIAWVWTRTQIPAEIGSRDQSPSLCNVNIFCIVQCGYLV